jgi:hypothetical protein
MSISVLNISTPGTTINRGFLVHSGANITITVTSSDGSEKVTGTTDSNGDAYIDVSSLGKYTIASATNSVTGYTTSKYVYNEVSVGYNPVQTLTVSGLKTEWYKGDTISYSGVKVTASYLDTTTKDVTTSAVFSPASGTTLSTTGNVSVTVSYTENGITATNTTTITVSDLKIVTWANGTDAEIAKMVEAADAGQIKLSDYWSVGDTRTVSLSAQSYSVSGLAIGTGISKQSVDLVLMNAGGKTLTNGKTCSFVVGTKNSLVNSATTNYQDVNSGFDLNSNDVNSGGWAECPRRTWLNYVIPKALPTTLSGIFKQFTNSNNSGGSTTDYFALPSEYEVFGSSNYSGETSGTQFTWYKTSSNRAKTYGGSSCHWWERSVSSGDSRAFCNVNNDGSAYYSNANIGLGLSFFGCI